jgi:hypothetical protein
MAWREGEASPPAPQQPLATQSDADRRRLQKLERDKEGARRRRAEKRKKREASEEGPVTSEAAPAAQAFASPSPAWPSKAEVAAAEAFMAGLWSQARVQLHGTRYGEALQARDLVGRVVHEDGRTEDVTIKADPVETLTKGTAPLAAQLMGKVEALTPTTQAMTALAMVFGPALLAHAKELLVGLFSTTSSAGAQ